MWFRKCADYILLTKPRIVLLFALTGFAALALEGRTFDRPWWVVLVCLGMIGTAASANGLNQYLERDRDALMERTRVKRPLPSGRIAPFGAFLFSTALGIAACVLFWWITNWLSTALAAGTILFYVIIYTLWLKPRTPYNIVIGGAAGATAPLIAWAAATGTLHWVPIVLFLIIFLWTPPHFSALALCYTEDYRTAGFPMLPVVRGEERTRKEIWRYSWLVVPLPLLLAWWPAIGWLYTTGALLLGIGFFWLAYRARYRPSKATAGGLFGYSIVYLLALSLLLITDALL